MKNNINKELQKIFDSKVEFHRDQARLPIEKKLKILIELQKIGKIANPEKTKGKMVWKI